MPCDLRLLFHKRDQTIADLIDLNRRNTDALQSFDRTKRTDQRLQIRADIASIAAGVNAGQYDFTMSVMY